MNREEAKRRIDSIDFYLQHHTDDYGERDHDAMMMAISALEQQTVEEMEREYEKSKALFNKIVESEDAVSRDAAIKALSHGEGCRNICANAIRRLPSVTRQSGKWNSFELFQSGIKEEYHECSVCKWSSALLIPRNFCPNCGAEMRGAE